MGYWSHEFEISSTISIQEKKTTEKKNWKWQREISLLLEFGQSHEQESRFYMMSSFLFQTLSLILKQGPL